MLQVAQPAGAAQIGGYGDAQTRAIGPDQGNCGWLKRGELSQLARLC